MDEVISVTNGYGCGNRIKSGTVGYLLNQSSDEPSTTTTGGGAKLRRQLRFLVASFWRLAYQVGGLVSPKRPSASVKSLSIIGRNGGEGGPPTSMERGESPFHSRSSTTTFRPTWSRTKTENCVDRRTKRTNPLVLIGTIEERKRMVAPFAQGTSSENNVGDRVRTFRWLRPLSVGSSLDMEIDPDRDLYLSIDI